MLTICPAVCALTMLAALADARLLGCHSELGGVGTVAAVLVHGDGDVVAAGWFGHAWDCRSGF
jgi:hypothetical protein